MRKWITLYPIAVTWMATASLLTTACQGESERQSTPLLEEARKNEDNFSRYVPKNPFKQIGEHLLERKLFETTGPAGVRIELRDLFVVPGTRVDKLSLPGPALLQVLSGQGKITTAEKSEELGPGTSVTLTQDASFALDSPGITPLILRARIFIP